MITFAKLQRAYDKASHGLISPELGQLSRIDFANIVQKVADGMPDDDRADFIKRVHAQGWFMFQGTMMIKGMMGMEEGKVMWWVGIGRGRLMFKEVKL